MLALRGLVGSDADEVVLTRRCVVRKWRSSAAVRGGFRCGVRCAERAFWRLCVGETLRCGTVCADWFVRGVDQDIPELMEATGGLQWRTWNGRLGLAVCGQFSVGSRENAGEYREVGGRYVVGKGFTHSRQLQDSNEPVGSGDSDIADSRPPLVGMRGLTAVRISES